MGAMPRVSASMYAYNQLDVNEFREMVQEAAAVLATVLGPSLCEIIMFTFGSEGPYWCTYDVVSGSAVERNVAIVDTNYV